MNSENKSNLDDIQKSLSPECIIYVYCKNGEELKRQELYLKGYCDLCEIKPIKIYKDTGKNFLDNKPNLKQLLLENKDIDIIILNNSRLSRRFEDMFSIADICEENNLRIFSTRENEFIFDEFFNFFKKTQEQILNKEL
mgnify:CR=1 FL=1